MKNLILIIFSELAEKFIFKDFINLKYDKLCKKLKNIGLHIHRNKLNKNLCNDYIEKIKHHLKSEYTMNDSEKSDKRIFGFEFLVPEVVDLFNDFNFFDIAKSFYNTNNIAFTVMANHTKFTPDNLGSGGGWHRDSPIKRQLKAMIYLNDVNHENGCFVYIERTCTLKSKLKNFFKKTFYWKKYRYSDSDISLFDDNAIKKLKGKSGTIIIFNSKGLHRGSVLKKDERFALTIYCYPKKLPSSVSEMIKSNV